MLVTLMERYLYNLGGGAETSSSDDIHNLGRTERTQQEEAMLNHPSQAALVDAISAPSYLESLSLFRQQQRAAAAQAAFAMTENQLGLSASTLSLANQINALSSYRFPGSAGISSDALLRANYYESNPFLLPQLLQSNNFQPSYAHHPPPNVDISAMLAVDRTTTDHYADRGILGPWSVTSAGVLDKIAQLDKADGAKKKALRRKPKNRPKRPLSAYNIFFKDERGRILSEIPGEHQGEHGDKKGKRKKSPHGKIGFESLAKTIGKRWQSLDPARVEHYKSKAAEDMVRYKEEMEVFLVAKQGGKINDDDDAGNNKDENPEEGTSEKMAVLFDMSQPSAKRRRTEGLEEEEYRNAESNIPFTG
jgi:HMG-box domain